MSEIIEWGADVSKLPVLIYLDGLRPINGKFRRYLENGLTKYSDFAKFKSDVEAGKYQYYLKSEKGQDALTQDKSDSVYSGFTRLTGQTYWPFIEKQKKDLLMFYMVDDDYRSKNMKKLLDEAIKTIEKTGGYDFEKAYIDTEKNEIAGYTFSRAPYIAIAKTDGQREYKIVWTDRVSTIVRFMTKHLKKDVGFNADI